MPHRSAPGHKPGRRARQPQTRYAPAPATGRLVAGDPAALLLHLQRAAGNQAVNALLRQQQPTDGRAAPAAGVLPVQRARIGALLKGTRAEGQAPGASPPDARLEANAVELHELLQGDLDEAKRERIMALHRRPVAEITGLDTAYARLYGRELSVVLGERLTELQRNRMEYEVQYRAAATEG